MYTRTISIAVVLAFLIASLAPIAYVYGDDAAGIYGQNGSIGISSAEELSLIGVDENYPLDATYVQTSDIVFDEDFNGGFDIDLTASLNGNVLTVSLAHPGGTPMTSDGDMYVVVNGEAKTIPSGSSSAEFDIVYANFISLMVVVAGSANLFEVGITGDFACITEFVLGNFETDTITINSNGNMDPIGSGSPFIGVYNGNGFAIRGLVVSSYVVMGDAAAGLFGNVSGSTVLTGIHLEGVSVAVAPYVNAAAGGLVGSSGGRSLHVTDCHVNGIAFSMSSLSYGGAASGGLVGSSGSGTFLRNSQSSVYTISAAPSNFANAGGLIGVVDGSVVIENCIASNVVTVQAAKAYAGGLAAQVKNLTVTESYSSTDISSVSVNSASGTNDSSLAVSGGIAGDVTEKMNVTECYTTGNISSSTSKDDTATFAGGIVGSVNDLKATNCYVTGSVTADGKTPNSGGIVGSAEKTSEITNCYVTGSVTSTIADTSGAAGNFSDSGNYITNFYFLKTVTVNPDLELFKTGTVTVDGLETGTRSEVPSGGYDESVLKAQDSYYNQTTTVDDKIFDGWNFTEIWFVDTSGSTNDGYPVLRTLLSVSDLFDKYANIGDDVTFVAITNSWATNWQWQIYDNGNWSDIYDATDSNYTINNINDGTMWNIYRCVVSCIIDDVFMTSKASGPGQILPLDQTVILTVSDTTELSKVGSNEIINNMIFRPSGNYLQTTDLQFPIPGTDDLNGGFYVIIAMEQKTIEKIPSLVFTLYYGDDARTKITSSSKMIVVVNGTPQEIEAGESSAAFMILGHDVAFDVVAGGSADNIPTGMDDRHPNFAVSTKLVMSGGAAESGKINSNGNFDPLGSEDLPFNGTYDGQGYTINGLKTSVFTGTDAYSGLFGFTRSAEIKNLNLTDSTAHAVAIASIDLPISFDEPNNMLELQAGAPLEQTMHMALCGTFVGYSNGDLSIINCSSDGTAWATGIAFAGGFLGISEGNVTIMNSYTTGDVFSSSMVAFSGGLLGAVGSTATVSECYTTGNITSTEGTVSAAGGLGGMFGGKTDISKSYTNSDIYAHGGVVALAGGIGGTLTSSAVTNCYVTGQIYAESGMVILAGGITGMFQGDFSVTNCYLAGEVMGVGEEMTSYLFASGRSGDSNNFITNFYYVRTADINADLELNSTENSEVIVDGGITDGQKCSGDRTPEELRKMDTYYDGIRYVNEEAVSGWDFTNVWSIDEGSSSDADERKNNGLPYLGVEEKDVWKNVIIFGTVMVLITLAIVVLIRRP